MLLQLITIFLLFLLQTSIISSATLLHSLQSNQPTTTSSTTERSEALPTTEINTSDTADVVSDIKMSNLSVEQMQQDLQKHEEKHHSSIKMLHEHQLQLQNMKAILNNASKVLSTHLRNAQEKDKKNKYSDIEARLESKMKQNVEVLVDQRMKALESKMEKKMDRILNAAAKRLGDEVTKIARTSIQMEVDNVINKYMEPPYTKGMMMLVRKEVSLEIDRRLDSAVLKEVNNVTAGVVDGLQWKEPEEHNSNGGGVHVIDVDGANGSKDDSSEGWELGAANASRFKRSSITTTAAPIIVERADGYIVNPQMDPVIGTPLYSYDEKNDAIGPDHWGEITPLYRTCNTGRHQSPIDIRTPSDVQANQGHQQMNAYQKTNVRYDPYLSEVTLSYNDMISPLILQNKGHVVEISVADNKKDGSKDQKRFTLRYGKILLFISFIFFTSHTSYTHTLYNVLMSFFFFIIPTSINFSNR